MGEKKKSSIWEYACIMRKNATSGKTVVFDIEQKNISGMFKFSNHANKLINK